MGMFKNFILKQTLKSKMKDVPEAQRDQMMQVVEAHPEFFKKVGQEVEQLKKQGKSEMAATMEVMRKHQGELQRLMQSQ